MAGAHSSDCAWRSSARALLGKVSSAWRRVQVFVANPNKTPAIVTILVSNRDKLLKYLGDFHTDKGSRTWLLSSSCVESVLRFKQGASEEAGRRAFAWCWQHICKHSGSCGGPHSVERVA